MNLFKKTMQFFQEVKQELHKVSWPSRQELIGSTYVVIVITGIMALYIGIIDIFLSKFLSVVFR
ncbi:MAG: preprotein translocase subunit SecE [Candidatus Omnitrophota bacterium]|nr:MAG: preprotein translocase subunit SecE [Candidatus Omnitrophota bacterium]